MTEERLIFSVAIELSCARWVIGALPPRGAKVALGAPGACQDRTPAALAVEIAALHQLAELLVQRFSVLRLAPMSRVRC